jgi:hypothetical protein
MRGRSYRNKHSEFIGFFFSVFLYDSSIACVARLSYRVKTLLTL